MRPLIFDLDDDHISCVDRRLFQRAQSLFSSVKLSTTEMRIFPGNVKLPYLRIMGEHLIIKVVK